jgi:hypothetical protein
MDSFMFDADCQGGRHALEASICSTADAGSCDCGALRCDPRLDLREITAVRTLRTGYLRLGSDKPDLLTVD